MTIPRAVGSDFVLVNLFRGPVGAPMRPRTIGDLLAAASRRAGLATAVTPHQLRHAFGSSAADAGCGIDVVADLLGHASVSSSQVYVHPDPGRLRAAVDAVPSPREQAGVTRGPALWACWRHHRPRLPGTSSPPGWTGACPPDRAPAWPRCWIRRSWRGRGGGLAGAGCAR